MNTVIVLEIVVGIFVLAAAVRFAVRDTRQRRGVTESGVTESTESAATGEAALAPSGKHEAEQHPSEVTDQREGEEVAALSASSTTPEPPADAR